MKTLIVIPTYNEIENIGPLVEELFIVLKDKLTEVLIVDDGSPDGTGKFVDHLSKKDPRIHVIHRKGKQGLGTAYVAGFSWGLARDFEAFIEMDADFSHSPKHLIPLFSALETHDFVIGSRYVSGGGTINWGVFRKLISLGGSFYSRLILGVPIRDFTGGFNGWKRKVLEGVDLPSLRSDGYSFQIELKYRACLKGFLWKEFPILFEDRKVGASKMNSSIIIEALYRVWQFRFRKHRRA